jgi:hypothetical protein
MCAKRRVKRSTSTGRRRTSRPKGVDERSTEQAGWGVPTRQFRCPPEFSSVGLLIPRDGFAAGDETVSPAARSRAAVSTGAKLSLRVPAKEAAAVLYNLGIRSTREPGLADERECQSRFAPFESLGITAAFFRDERDHQRVMNELHSDYEYIEDFPLALPCRVAMKESPFNRRLTAGEPSDWPDESGVARAHRKGVRGAGVLAAVLDTGVDADHQEFAGKRINYRYVSFYPSDPNWPPRDVRGFDVDGHGTHVCGILAGQKKGAAPESSLYVASVIESETTLTSVTRVVAGLQWVMRQFTRPDNERMPAVLSMSLGFPGSLAGDDSSLFKKRLDTMRLLLRTLRQANVLPIVAIGNEGAGRFGYPGAFDEVIGVGAVDYSLAVPDFSGSGAPPKLARAKPDVVGYGVGVNSSIERDYDGKSVYQNLNGTSMATPYVAAIAALYRSEDPRLTVDEVESKLKETALPIKGAKGRVGAGLARYH